MKCFIKDDDSHWYLIDVSDRELFLELIEAGEDRESEFTYKFDRLMCDQPQNYMFKEVFDRE